MENKVNIVINGREIVIRKIPLGKYPRIIESVKSLAVHKEAFSGISESSIIDSLPLILEVGTPEVINLINIITEVPKEEIEASWGLDDFIRCVEAILEVNNFTYIYTTIKKAMTRLKTVKPGAIQQETSTASGIGSGV